MNEIIRFLKTDSMSYSRQMAEHLAMDATEDVVKLALRLAKRQEQARIKSKQDATRRAARD